VLFDGTSTHVFRHPRIRTTSTHGTGCTLSSGITAQLARGSSLADATRVALDYVHEAIRSAPGLGKGNGPLRHRVDGTLQRNKPPIT
jgi:hydroxymethylpyrimidine/phosphomethylpyrimidine kinase